MTIKAIEDSNIYIKVDKTPNIFQMNGRERHLALGRLLKTDTISLDIDDIVSFLSKGYSILPKIENNNKIMQSLFAIDLLDISNISMYINTIFAYEKIGIPPFATFKLESNTHICTYRLLFATNISLYDEKDINKFKAILRAIAYENGALCKCPYIIDGCLTKTHTFYGDIRVDAKNVLKNFNSSHKKYILNDSTSSSKIRYSKNWFKN